jgi:PhnB protein
MATYSRQPQTHSTLSPYIIVPDVRRAVQFYEDVFGAVLFDSIEMENGTLGHAEVRINDSVLMIGGEFPDLGFRAPQAYNGSSISLHLYIDNVDDVVAHALDAGARIVSDVEDKFYGDRVGVIVDPFGHQWQIATKI